MSAAALSVLLWSFLVNSACCTDFSTVIVILLMIVTVITHTSLEFGVSHCHSLVVAITCDLTGFSQFHAYFVVSCTCIMLEFPGVTALLLLPLSNYLKFPDIIVSCGFL